MLEALLQLSLFTAKVLIIVLGIIVILLIFFALLYRGKFKPKERLIVSDMNKKYDEMADQILHETLPKKEFKILLLLHQNQNKFFSKKELALSVWNDENVAKKRTIDVHIYNIRQIFGKKIIQSQKGKGYRLNKKYFV